MKAMKSVSWRLSLCTEPGLKGCFKGLLIFFVTQGAVELERSSTRGRIEGRAEAHLTLKGAKFT
jgi:hypothetical protein